MAIFVLLISIMGIYAVSSASIHAQMKDISIRKVCGAELLDLLGLYMKKYLYLCHSSFLHAKQTRRNDLCIVEHKAVARS